MDFFPEPPLKGKHFTVNSEKLSEVLKERSLKSQIIIVSLKDSVVSRASEVFGIYRTNGVSQIIKYRPKLEVPIGYA